MKGKVMFPVFVVVILMGFVLAILGEEPKETKQIIGKLIDEKGNPVAGKTLWLAFSQEGSFFARVGLIERNGKEIIDWSMPFSITNNKGEFVIKVGKEDTGMDFSIGTKEKKGQTTIVNPLMKGDRPVILEAEILKKSRQIDFGLIILNKDNKLLIYSEDQIIFK